MLKSNSKLHSIALAVALSMTALGSGTLAISPAHAQYGAYVQGQAYFSQEQIDQLVAPIALYPDPLLAQVLAAAAYPNEINAAHQYSMRYRDYDRQPWDTSVRSVAHYPTALNWLAADPARTQALGIAYINQPDMVANAIQRWRAQAYGLGNLYSNQQQVVYVQGDYVRIVPAQPQLIYVPVYEPRVIYVERYRPNYSFLTFGLGLAIGAWLDQDWDWNHRRAYYYDRNRYVSGRPVFYAQFDRVYVDQSREWRPERDHFRAPTQVVYPTTLRTLAPPPPADRKPRDRDTLAGPGNGPGPGEHRDGIVTKPGTVAPVSTKPGDVDKNGRPIVEPKGKGAPGAMGAPVDKPGPAAVVPTDKVRPVEPGKPADGDKGKAAVPQDPKGRAMPNGTAAPAPADRGQPIDRGQGEQDRGKGQPQGSKGAPVDTPRSVTAPPGPQGNPPGNPPGQAVKPVQPAPAPAAVPPGGGAPKKVDPKDEPADGKGNPNKTERQ